MPKYPESTTNITTQMRANWSYIRNSAAMMLTEITDIWQADVKGFRGLDIQLIDIASFKPKSIFHIGELSGQSYKYSYTQNCNMIAVLVFYGAVSGGDQQKLAQKLQGLLEWLNELQPLLVSSNAFNKAPIVMYQAINIDNRWVLMQANEAFEKFIGAPVQDFIGGSATRQVSDYVHPDDFARLMSSYDFTRTTSQQMTLQYRLKSASGEYVPVTERVHYSRSPQYSVCNSVVWHRSLDQVDSLEQFTLFKSLESFTQDVSIETGRDFLFHFCRRLEASQPLNWLMLCAKTTNGWWETWVVSENGTVQPNYMFQMPEPYSSSNAYWNSNEPREHKDDLNRLLFGGYPYQSQVSLTNEAEEINGSLFFGSVEPIKDPEFISQILRLIGVRLLREINQARIALAQTTQNELLTRQKFQLTHMVTLLGQLDTVADDQEFLFTTQTHLQKAFDLESLDWVYWDSGEWNKTLYSDQPEIEWFQKSFTVHDSRWLEFLEICRREDQLTLDKPKRQVFWPLGQSKVGYLVLVVAFKTEVPDMELMHFSRNALVLALQGLLQRENLRQQAMRDSLTGLGNRVQLHAWIKVALPTQSTASLLLFDLNRFKEINDSFGHQFGDKLLCEIGPRISGHMRDTPHYLARLGGDEFALFFPNTKPEQALKLAESVSEVLGESYFIDRLRFQVEASVGLAHFPEHGKDGHELLRSADVAMYEAKNSSRKVVEFSAALDTKTPLRIAVLSELDSALDEGQLSVVYQPLMSASTGLAAGFEALIRWTHPTFGPLAPDEFIPIAEMGEGIRKITDFVLRNAMTNVKNWRELMPGLHIAVNISPRVLLDHQFPINIKHMLDEYGLPGEAIVLELTESTLLVDPIRAVEIINSLASLGIKVEIDDYGTGYSSLAYLKSLPISTLKIDRSFVTDILTDSANQVIVSSTIKMAHSLDLLTVAEGVEDEATLLMLRRLDCDLIQGYYYSKPILEKEVSNWIKRNR